MTRGSRLVSAAWLGLLGFTSLAGAPAVRAAPVAQISEHFAPPRWAYPMQASAVRASPSTRAGVIGRLKFLTSDRQAQLYLAVGAARSSSGRRWVHLELPGRPNGRTGWVPRAALGPLHVAHERLLIDRVRLHATLYRGTHAVFAAPIGIGKPSTPTPAGDFYVIEKLTTRANPTYGPYAIGTSAYAPTLSEWPGGGVVGIHGTDQPQLIPGEPSHGCVRMRNSDIARLWALISLGTPIQIV